MLLENRNYILKSLFSQYLSHQLAHFVCSILIHWVELCLVLKSRHFDIHVSALVVIHDMGMYKNSFILHFSMLLVLMKLHVAKNKKEFKKNHYLRFQLKTIKTGNSSHVLFMKNLFSGDKNRSQNQIILSPRQVVTIALKGGKKAVKLTKACWKEKKMCVKHSKFMKL